MLQLRQKLNQKGSGFKGVGNVLSNVENNIPWNILKENISLPALTLSQSTLKHNQSWMNKFAEKFDFQLAPHGKTTMLPELFSFQISSGCWGITLASATQVAAAYKHGVKRVIMANQLIGDCNMDIVSTILKDPDFEFMCIVDSPDNVAQLGHFFQSRNQKLQVLLEFGPMGGRTGIRNSEQENAVLNELKKWPNLFLVGIEFFEGILKEEQGIREFICHCLLRTKGLAEKKAFAQSEIIVTGAGTSWFDVVAEEFLAFEKASGLALKKILRAGCYLTYDGGMYSKMEKRVLDMNLGQNSGFHILSETLKPAIKVWAYVQSIPELDLAILSLGRRDIAMDCGYPIPHSQFRLEDGQRKRVTQKNGNDLSDIWKVFNMMDQHTFMKINANDDVQVGDIIAFDIYHACTTMDKWRNVLLIDDVFNVIDIYHSEF